MTLHLLRRYRLLLIIILGCLGVMGHYHPTIQLILQFSLLTTFAFQSGPLFKDSTSLFISTPHLKRRRQYWVLGTQGITSPL